MLENDDVIITGSESQKALSELQKSVGNEINLTMNDKGNVSYTCNTDGPLSENAQQLVNAIDDHSVVARIGATTNHNIPFTQIEFVIDAFLGSKIDPETNLPTGYNVMDPNVAATMSDHYEKPGQDVLHGVIEAYRAGVITKETCVNGFSSAGSDPVYIQAHALPTPQQSGAIKGYKDSPKFFIYPTDKNDAKLLYTKKRYKK